jgi:hypothetical protein
VLVVKKLSSTEIRLAEANALDYEVFMAIPKTAGIDKRGNPVYLRTPEGFELQDESLNPMVDDEISLVAGSFSRWVKERGYVGD